MRRIRKHTILRRDLSGMRTRLQKETGMRGLSFKYTRNVDTATRAAINALKRIEGKDIEYQQVRKRWKHSYASIIPIRGKNFLIFISTGTKNYHLAHEVAHVAYKRLARAKNKEISKQINEGLAYSFQTEYMKPEEVSELFDDLFPKYDTRKGVELAEAIWKTSPNNLMLRGKIRKEIFEKGFRTTAQAIAYLKQKYDKKR